MHSNEQQDVTISCQWTLNKGQKHIVLKSTIDDTQQINEYINTGQKDVFILLFLFLSM